VVYAKLTPKFLDPKLAKAQGGFNRVFWRPKVPLRGLATISVLSFVVLMYAQALLGWVGSSANVAFTHPLSQQALSSSPTMCFLGLFLLGLVRKGVGLDRLGLWGSPKTNWSHRIRHAALALIALYGAHRGGLRYAPSTTGTVDINPNPLSPMGGGLHAGGRLGFDTAPTHHAVWNRLAVSNLNTDRYSGFLRKMPTLAFKANASGLVLGHSLYACRPAVVTVGACDSSTPGFPVSLASLTLHIRLSSISSLGGARVWASLSNQPEERVRALRLLISA